MPHYVGMAKMSATYKNVIYRLISRYNWIVCLVIAAHCYFTDCKRKATGATAKRATRIETTMPEKSAFLLASSESTSTFTFKRESTDGLMRTTLCLPPVLLRPEQTCLRLIRGSRRKKNHFLPSSRVKETIFPSIAIP